MREIKNVTGGNELPLVEEFYSIQGEGFHCGKAAYFIRLAGCDIGCKWCDTPFSWDPALHPLVDTDSIIARAVNSGTDSVVVTGGEPFMWDLGYLCSGLRQNNIRTFVETSGAYPVSGEWNWICLSPKRQKPPLSEVCESADELKVIIENDDDFAWAEKYRKLVGEECILYLQPEWSRFGEVIGGIVCYVKKNPSWRISLQIHKYMRIP